MYDEFNPEPCDRCMFLFLRTLLPCKSRCQLRLVRVICSFGEHVHSCCVLDVTLVELLHSRIMSDHCPDDSSVFLFLTLSSACYCHPLKFILVVTITCSTDHDDSSYIHTTCFACCVCRSFLVIDSASLLVWNTVHMESGLDGISCLWKYFYNSGQNLSVDWSDHVNEDGSILLSTVQTELIENQLTTRILKSVNTVSSPGMFSLWERDDRHLNTAVFPKTDNDCAPGSHSGTRH